MITPYEVNPTASESPRAVPPTWKNPGVVWGWER